MTEQDVLSLSIIQRAITMQKAMDELRKNIASRQINNILNIWNKSSTASMHNLSINSPVLEY